QKSSSESASSEWRSATPPGITLDQAGALPSAQPEPLIRVALATDVRSATVSTAGHLLNASEDGPAPIALEVARVRLEPRLLSPAAVAAANNADAFRVQMVGLVAREYAEQKSREVQEASGEESQIVYDNETRTWRLVIGAIRPQLEAEELRARLEDAGLEATVLAVGSNPPSENSA